MMRTIAVIFCRKCDCMVSKVVEAKRDILSAYRLWLNNKVANDISPAYGQLLAILWRTEFVAEYQQDENRIEDARGLRDEFADSIDIENADYLKLKATPVRLIEVMISLAVRISNIISVDGDTSKYFWEMVASLELQKLDDGNYNASSAQKHIDILLGHKYRRNGRGGLFFIRDIGPEYNAPMLDLWTQAMAWINSKAGR